MASPWVWNAKARRYRNTRTGRFIGPKQMLELRDQFVAAMQDDMRRLTQRLARRDLTIQDYVVEARRLMRTTHVDEYVLARGGRGQMTASDWGKLGATLKFQYERFQAFAQEIAAGQMSVAQINRRALMYVDAATQSFEQGQAGQMGITLPAHPGDGSTECLTNCKCHWSIVEQANRWECTWVKTAKESCPTCKTRARTWNPLVIPKTRARFRADLDVVLFEMAR